MPHSFLKSIKLNLAQYAAVALAYAEGIARRYAEKKILEICLFCMTMFFYLINFMNI